MKYILYLYRHKNKIIFIFCFLSVYGLKFLLGSHTFNRLYRSDLRNKYNELSVECSQKSKLLKEYEDEKKALVSNAFYQEKIGREELFLIKKGDFVFRV